MCPPVVLDTNVLVAAGFRPESASGRLVRAVASGRLRLAWDAPTRQETARVIGAIPPLEWGPLDALYREEERFAGATDPDRFPEVPDASDRKFAALA
ncbi:MAG: PIN domain-containing protein, partial [Rhodothermales bacterium]|nr:PIN domain-containing protein [Rhodothermales bacterium]